MLYIRATALWPLLHGTPVTSLLCRWLLNCRVWCLKCCGMAMTDNKYEGRRWCLKLASDQFTMWARGAKRTGLGINNVTTRTRIDISQALEYILLSEISLQQVESQLFTSLCSGPAVLHYGTALIRSGLLKTKIAIREPTVMSLYRF